MEYIVNGKKIVINEDKIAEAVATPIATLIETTIENCVAEADSLEAEEVATLADNYELWKAVINAVQKKLKNLDY